MATSRGIKLDLMIPSREGLPATAREVSTMATVPVAFPEVLESAITISPPLLISTSPTGLSPTWTSAIKALAGWVRNLAAEKPSRALLSRAVTHTKPPSGDVITRIGLHPAAVAETTGLVDAVSAAYMSITLTRPVVLLVT